MHNADCTTAAVICHGLFALLSTRHRPQNPQFAYAGYEITCWSDAEERLVETVKGATVPVKVEASLREASAEVVSTLGKKLGDTTVDREVVSGSNPMAMASLGAKIIELLNAN